MKKLTTIATVLAFASALALTGCKKKEEAAPAAPAGEKKPEEKPADVKPEEKKPEEKPAAAAGTGSPECDAYLATLEKYITCDKIPEETKKSTKEAVEMSKAGWASLNDPAIPAEAKKAATDGCKAGEEGLKKSAEALGCSL